MLHYGIIAALIGGVFIAVQGGINGMIGNKVGIFATVIVPVLAQFAILCAVVLLKRDLIGNILKLKDIKFGLGFLIISALLGLGIMNTLTLSIMKIGPLVAFAIVIFSQLFTSMIVEHLGLLDTVQRSISGYRILGLLAMIVGIGLFYK